MIDYKKALRELTHLCNDVTLHEMYYDVNEDVQVFVQLCRKQVLYIEIQDMNNKSGKNLENIELWVLDNLQTALNNASNEL